MTGAVCDEQFYGKDTTQTECIAVWESKKKLAELILFRQMLPYNRNAEGVSALKCLFPSSALLIFSVVLHESDPE